MNVNVWVSISHIATGLWEDPKPKAFFLPWEQVWPSCYKWQFNKWSSEFPLWLEIWCWFILQKQRWNEQWKWRTGPENMWWLTIKVVIYTHKILSLLDNWVMFPIQIRWDHLQDLPRDKQRGFRHPYQRWSAVPLPHQFLGLKIGPKGVMQPWGIKDGNGKMTTIG